MSFHATMVLYNRDGTPLQNHTFKEYGWAGFHIGLQGLVGRVLDKAVQESGNVIDPELLEIQEACDQGEKLKFYNLSTTIKGKFVVFSMYADTEELYYDGNDGVKIDVQIPLKDALQSLEDEFYDSLIFAKWED